MIKMQRFLYILLICLSSLAGTSQQIGCNNTPSSGNDDTYTGSIFPNYGGVSGALNTKYSVSGSIGQLFIGDAFEKNYQTSLGFYTSFLLPPKPPIVTATQGDLLDRVQIRWEIDPLSPAASGGFNIYRDGVFMENVGPSVKNFNDFNVIAGYPYNYTVRGVNTFGEGYPGTALGFQVPNGVVTGWIQTPSGNPVIDAMVSLTPTKGFSAKFGSVAGAWVDSIGQNVPSLVPSGNQPWSLSFWVKTDSATNNAAIIKLEPSLLEIRPLNSATGNDAIIVAVNTANNLRANFPVATRKDWHHIVLTYDPELTRYRLYLDGVLEDLESGGLVIPAISRIDFAEAIDKPGTWEGRLDELRIYDRTLDVLEINEIGKGTASTLTPGLFRYWKMDEEEGTASFDLFKRNKLNFCGAVFDEDQAPVSTSAKTNEEGYYRIESANYGTGTTFIAKADKNFYLHRSLYLKSSQGDYITLPHFKMSRKMTFEFWVNHDGPQPMDQTLLSKTWSGNELSIQLKQSGADNRIFFKINNVTKDFGVVDAGYQHLAFTLDSLNGQVKFYRNGSQQGGNQTFGYVEGTWADSTTFLVGARWLNSNRVDFFNGLIDEVAMYDTTLTLSTIQSHFNASRVPTEKHLVQYYAMDEGSGSQLNNSGSLLNGTGSHSGADWSSFAVHQEATPHFFTPSSRQVTLNPSVTSVDQVDFIDRSVVPVSGYVRYKNTDCFAPNVEILVNGNSFQPPIFTDSTGKFTVDFDPGTSAVLSPSLESHVFQPASWQVTNLINPMAGLLFNDVTTRDITGKVAGGLCEKSIIKANIPSGQGAICIVKVAAVNGCYVREKVVSNQEGDFEFLDLPPLSAFTVSIIEHSNPLVKAAFQLSGGQTVNLTYRDTLVKFIYFAPPEALITGGLDPVAGCNPPQYIIEQDEQKEITIQVKEQYEYILTQNMSGIDTLDDGVCFLDTAGIEIIDGFSDTRIDTVLDGLELMYSFRAGVPNPTPPFRKTLQVIAASVRGQKGSVLREAIITGIRNKENTFTTQLPEVPLLILRDPPGDGSYSYWEKDNNVCTTISTILDYSVGGGAGTTVDLGPKIQTLTQPFGGAILEIDSKLGFQVSGNVSYKKVDETSMNVCLSTSERISTSSDELILGKDADIYVGLGMNISVGYADEVKFNPMTCQASVEQIITVEPLGATAFMYSGFHIANNVIRYLDDIVSNPTSNLDSAGLADAAASSVLWQSFLDDNETLKTKSDFIKNLSFDAGVSYEYSETSDTVHNKSTKEYVNSDGFVRSFFGGGFQGVGLEGEIKFTYSTSKGTNLNESSEQIGVTTGYVLADNDPGDAFSVNVSMDTVYQTPVFNLLAGQSSCPWEENSANREGVNLNLSTGTPFKQINVPANEAAVFKLNLGNLSATNEDWTYGFTAIAGTNPDGAIIKVNGTVLNNNTIRYIVPYGDAVPITLTIERGPVAYVYENLEVALVSECEFERNLALSLSLDRDSLFYKSLKLGVEFIRPCSEVAINVPEQNWVMHNNNLSGDTLRITASGYDLSSTDFKLLRVQYRKTNGDGAWINIPGISERFNPNWSGLGLQTDTLQPGFTQFYWDTGGLPDGEYEIHAWAECNGLAADKPGFSDIIKGRIDREPPKLIGTPQPSDGVYSVGDEISFTFNKAINCQDILQVPDKVELFVDATNQYIGINVSCFENKITLYPYFDNEVLENQVPGPN
ncbi:MAG: LamG domain-containing protein [Saprospiraceae bacterium]|nr:LamG domain-containing protein [Saprospiraceae bacterium]